MPKKVVNDKFVPSRLFQKYALSRISSIRYRNLQSASSETSVSFKSKHAVSE
jgi:hypothetical protein